MIRDFSQKSNSFSTLFTYEEAACFLRLSPGTLRNWVCNGQLQLGRDYIKMGKTKNAPVRFKPDSLITFADHLSREDD